MPTCPNCGYELVLLARPKYKCALCSKLYPKKEIESRTFRIWNQKQKELDLHNSKLYLKELKELTRKPKLSEEEKKLKARESRKRSYYKNREKFKLKVKKHRQENREKYNESIRQWRNKTKSRRLIQSRIFQYRNRMKLLTLQHLKSQAYKTSNNQIEFYPPTISLSHLLILTKNI
tara:strand:- start:16 stop:543 length:528 start_codon:yes stop_codon:yes gene_type:complete